MKNSFLVLNAALLSGIMTSCSKKEEATSAEIQFTVEQGARVDRDL